MIVSMPGNATFQHVFENLKSSLAQAYVALKVPTAPPENPITYCSILSRAARNTDLYLYVNSVANNADEARQIYSEFPLFQAENHSRQISLRLKEIAHENDDAWHKIASQHSKIIALEKICNAYVDHAKATVAAEKRIQHTLKKLTTNNNASVVRKALSPIIAAVYHDRVDALEVAIGPPAHRRRAQLSERMSLYREQIDSTTPLIMAKLA